MFLILQNWGKYVLCSSIRQKWVKIESEASMQQSGGRSVHEEWGSNIHNYIHPSSQWKSAHREAFSLKYARQKLSCMLMSCLSFIGDKAPNTWHLIISKRECEWNIREIYLHASHLPDSLKSHTQSSSLLSAQRITQTVCMNNGHTLNPRCVAGKKERKIKRENENWSRCRGQTTETRGGQNWIITCVIEDSFERDDSRGSDWPVSNICSWISVLMRSNSVSVYVQIYTARILQYTVSLLWKRAVHAVICQSKQTKTCMEIYEP